MGTFSILVVQFLSISLLFLFLILSWSGFIISVKAIAIGLILKKRISFHGRYSHVASMCKAYETGIMIVYSPMHSLLQNSIGCF